MTDKVKKLKLSDILKKAEPKKDIIVDNKGLSYSQIKKERKEFVEIKKEDIKNKIK